MGREEGEGRGEERGEKKRIKNLFDVSDDLSFSRGGEAVASFR